MDSVTPGAEGIWAYQDDNDITLHFRPVHKLRFTVHEYLKGNGGDEVLVVARPLPYRQRDWCGPVSEWYAAKIGAEREAQNALSYRRTTWDDRQAILYLIPESTPWYSSHFSMTDVPFSTGRLGAPDSYVFPLQGPLRAEYYVGTWSYTIDTVERVWMPADRVEIPDNVNDIRFITDGRAKTAPGPTISLRDLKRLISEGERQETVRPASADLRDFDPGDDYSGTDQP